MAAAKSQKNVVERLAGKGDGSVDKAKKTAEAIGDSLTEQQLECKYQYNIRYTHILCLVYL